MSSPEVYEVFTCKLLTGMDMDSRITDTVIEVWLNDMFSEGWVFQSWVGMGNCPPPKAIFKRENVK